MLTSTGLSRPTKRRATCANCHRAGSWTARWLWWNLTFACRSFEFERRKKLILVRSKKENFRMLTCTGLEHRTSFRATFAFWNLDDSWTARWWWWIRTCVCRCGAFLPLFAVLVLKKLYRIKKKIKLETFPMVYHQLLLDLLLHALPPHWHPFSLVDAAEPSVFAHTG